MKTRAGLSVMFLFVMASLVILPTGCAKKEEEHASNAQQPEGKVADIENPQAEEAKQLSFEGVDIDGNQVSSAVLADAKITMINLLATYCNPCLIEMPGLGELAKEYDSGEFQIIGIISDVLETADQKTIDLAKELITQTKAQYTHLLLNESVYYALLTDVSAVPTTFFVDENGVILDTVIGAMDKSAWEAKISELLGKE